MIAALVKPSFFANFAHTVPWKGSMKQTRNTWSPTSVTFSFVEAGVIIGMPLR